MSFMNSESPIIQLEKLSRTFTSGDIKTQAIDELNLEIRKGEYLSISGPSGCGKSTLLSILGLLDTPTGGKFNLAGHQVEHFNSYQRAKLRNKEIGFVFQSFNLIGDLTVAENVALPLSYGDIPQRQHYDLVMDKLERVNLVHRAQHYPSQLSGGQQQRVAVARAIVINPSVLLADEPTGNLDSKNADATMALLDELNDDGTTICMVTHDARFANHAKRNISLFDGRLVS